MHHFQYTDGILHAEGDRTGAMLVAVLSRVVLSNPRIEVRQHCRVRRLVGQGERVVGAILLTAIVVIQDVHINLDAPRVLLAMGMAALLGLGVGTLNCVLIGFFPTWKNVWKVMTRPMFIVSGIFYTYDSVPAAFQHVLWYNPLVHVVGMMRSGFYGVYRDDYVSVPYVMGIALGTFVIGAWLLRRHASHLIEQ